jgi:hypothetical protein
MKYYPLSRVITGSKAVGNDFYLDGKAYTGPYYRTWENRYYTGNDPVTGDSKELTFIPSAKALESDEPVTGIQAGYSLEDVSLRESYKQVKQVNTLDLQGFSAIIPFYPVVTVVDYRRGYFFRYFAKKRNQNEDLIEISQDVHLSLQTVNSEYNYELYHSVELYWQLVGPLHDTVDFSTGVRTAGIIDTNKRLTETKNEFFKGLIDYIGGNYKKFGKPVA